MVDDNSSDGTGTIALKAAQDAWAADRLTLVEAGPLPSSWTGKLWAVSAGCTEALKLQFDFLLLTDADIVHAPDNVANLVARAERDGLDLASLMVKLRCRSLAERALIPAFVFFFLKLYPPAWTADPARKTAGAAGGCILIRPAALARIGGIASIRNELIDDCALARAVKRDGPIWMGLTSTTHSIRDYTSIGEIEAMIARTAYTQLNYSPLLLAGTIAGLTLTYLLPPALLLAGDLRPAAIGAATWALMCGAYLPTLRFYGRSPLWAPLLPAIAAFYTFATIHSAFAWWTGKGGAWKGRSAATPGICSQSGEDPR